MVNDLSSKSPLKSIYWKYVDDVAISEDVPFDVPYTLQDDLNTISSWAAKSQPKEMYRLNDHVPA